MRRACSELGAKKAWNSCASDEALFAGGDSMLFLYAPQTAAPARRIHNKHMWYATGYNDSVDT